MSDPRISGHKGLFDAKNSLNFIFDEFLGSDNARLN